MCQRDPDYTATSQPCLVSLALRVGGMRGANGGYGPGLEQVRLLMCEWCFLLPWDARDFWEPEIGSLS